MAYSAFTSELTMSLLEGRVMTDGAGGGASKYHRKEKPMTNLKDYANKYQNLEMERRDGILELRLHTRGGPHLWSESAHRELSYAFTDIACDTENKVVILTGKGDSFCADLDSATFSKYSGPDGVMLDVSQTGWVGTSGLDY